MGYIKKDELAFIREIRERILTENLSMLTRGTMFFHECEVIVTDDAEQEFISHDRPETVVETEYAQELSWLLGSMRDELSDTIYFFGKEQFYGSLSDAANQFLKRSEDRSGLLMAVLLEAAAMVAQARQARIDQLRDEVFSCAAGLNDLAERM